MFYISDNIYICVELKVYNLSLYNNTRRVGYRVSNEDEAEWGKREGSNSQ